MASDRSGEALNRCMALRRRIRRAPRPSRRSSVDENTHVQHGQYMWVSCQNGSGQFSGATALAKVGVLGGQRDHL